MKKLLITTSIIGLTAAAAPALASDLSYTYLQLDYSTMEIGGLDFDGPSLSGSYAVTDNLAISAGVGRLSDSGISITAIGVGVDYHMPLASNVDLIGSVGASEAKAKFQGNSATDKSINYGIGLRSKVAEAVEVEVGMSRDGDGGVLKGGTVWGASLAFDITPQVQVGAGISRYQGDNGYALGARYNF